MRNFFVSVIAQIAIVVCLPLMIALGVINCIHTWALIQCQRVWRER